MSDNKPTKPQAPPSPSKPQPQPPTPPRPVREAPPLSAPGQGDKGIGRPPTKS
jgi:hypothetical protein